MKSIALVSKFHNKDDFKLANKIIRNLEELKLKEIKRLF